LGDEFRVIAAAEGGNLNGPPGHVGEDMGAGFPVADVGKGSGVEAASTERMRGDEHQLRGVAIGHGTEQHLLDDGEHGGVDADTEAQGDDGGEGEGG
jgi:hypothetical protein